MEDLIHVVRTNGWSGTWGRGKSLQEAMENAKVKFNDKTPFTYYIFSSEDDWDIWQDGTVAWKKLVHKEKFLNGFKS